MDNFIEGYIGIGIACFLVFTSFEDTTTKEAFMKALIWPVSVYEQVYDNNADVAQ